MRTPIMSLRRRLHRSRPLVRPRRGMALLTVIVLVFSAARARRSGAPAALGVNIEPED